MNTNAIRDASVRARRLLMDGVEKRCLLFGIEEGAQSDLETIGGRVLSAGERKQRLELLSLQDGLREDGKPGSGHAALVEQAAYIWFNRLFAIRFMELNDRLPSHVRVLSAQDGSFHPECLREALDLPLDAIDRGAAAGLVAIGDDEGLFRLILLAQCAELAECMPAVFERVGSAMELLLPDGLLAKDGVVESLVTGISEDDWREGVEIVGWAYQFYVSERHDEFYASKRKARKEDIAPATQLFTPEYIVRFLTQNSLGRLWMLNNPSSPLADRMEYFVNPDPDSHEDYLRVSSPEEITAIDPACGSGHFLCYAFDLLASMYEERGYRRRDIPALILEKNLTGIEIDRRAASLTSFALTMKACEWDSRFLHRVVAPKVVCLESVELSPVECEAIGSGPEQKALVDVLAHLDEVGSLWQPTNDDKTTIDAWVQHAQADTGIFGGSAKSKLVRAQKYAQALTSVFTICVTNPPYMGSNKFESFMSSWTSSNYPDAKNDLCTCFVQRGSRFTISGGYNAMLTASSWMFVSSFERLRHWLIDSTTIISMTQLSTHGFPFVTVPTCMFVQLNNRQGIAGTYIRLEEFDRPQWQQPKTLEAIRNPSCGWRYDAYADNFKFIPGWPIAYWASASALNAFVEGTPLSDLAAPRQGFATGDNNRFLRCWWETDYDRIAFDCPSSDESLRSDAKWYPCNKGGAFRRWYGNRSLTVNWKHDGEEMKNFSGSVIRNPAYYFRDGMTWSTISSSDFSMRYSPVGTLFESKGSVCFPNDESLLPYYLGFLNSTCVQELQRILSPTLDYHEGPLGRIPVKSTNEETQLVVSGLTTSNISLSRADWDSFETSWDFAQHPLVRGILISSAFGLWSSECKERFDHLRKNEEQINSIFASIYHMENEVPVLVPEDKVSVRRADLGRDIRSLISYAVGCMFGRYSIDKPGLILANQGDGFSQFCEQVPHLRFMPDDDGILPITDDVYFEDDIVARFVEWVRAAYGAETLEVNLQYVADALGGRGSSRKVIRDYFMNQFFADHCATYSVPNAGKRPIYWLIDSGRKGGFRALVYMHRYTPDLLARVRIDYVHERQERYRSRITELERQREGASRRETAVIDRELRDLRAKLEEVTKFEERLHHLADQMIEIDLDDGFKVNYAKFKDVMAEVR